MSATLATQSPSDSVGPMAQARLNAQADLDGKATLSQIQWLTEHPQLWLRAVSRMEAAVALHLAEARAELDALHALRQSRASRREYDETAGRIQRARSDWLRLKRRIRRRKDEVIALVGTVTVAQLWMTGDAAAQMMQIVELLDRGDVEQAREKADRWAQAWASAPIRSEETA